MATFKTLPEYSLEGTAVTKVFLRKAGYEAAFQNLQSADEHRRVLIALTQPPMLTNETEDVEQRASVRKSIAFCGHIVFGVTATLQ